jgi:hypothetical protein
VSVAPFPLVGSQGRRSYCAFPQTDLPDVYGFEMERWSRSIYFRNWSILISGARAVSACLKSENVGWLANCSRRRRPYRSKVTQLLDWKYLIALSRYRGAGVARGVKSTTRRDQSLTQPSGVFALD